MALRTDLTTVSSFRILRTQREALDKLHPTLSGSALVRALLQLYFAGQIPGAYAIALKETKRAKADMRTSSKQKIEKVA